MMPLFEEPITKEQFERELLSLPPKEADSRREFWTLCEALQAMEDTKCPPPDWFIESFKKVLEYASEVRAEPWRELRHRLLEHMGEFQREPRATRQRQKRFRRYQRGRVVWRDLCFRKAGISARESRISK